jgi:hypothetical protein
MRRTNFLVTVDPIAPSRGGLMDKPSDYLNVGTAKVLFGILGGTLKRRAAG